MYVCGRLQFCSKATFVSVIDILFKRSMVVSVLLMVQVFLILDNLCALNKSIAVWLTADCKLYLSQTLRCFYFSG